VIACGCGATIAISPATYNHTQVFEGVAVLVCFDCAACGTTRAVATWEAADDDEQPIAAE